MWRRQRRAGTKVLGPRRGLPARPVLPSSHHVHFLRSVPPRSNALLHISGSDAEQKKVPHRISKGLPRFTDTNLLGHI